MFLKNYHNQKDSGPNSIEITFTVHLNHVMLTFICWGMKRRVRKQAAGTKKAMELKTFLRLVRDIKDLDLRQSNNFPKCKNL